MRFSIGCSLPMSREVAFPPRHELPPVVPWLDSVRSCVEFEQPWYRNKMDMTCWCYPPWRKPGLLRVPTGQQLESSIDNSAPSMQRRVATWLRGAWSVIMNYVASEQRIRTPDTPPAPDPLRSQKHLYIRIKLSYILSCSLRILEIISFG